MSYLWRSIERMFGDDPVEQIRRAVEELAAEDRREWSGPARSDRLVELIEVAERLQAETVWRWPSGTPGRSGRSMVP